MKLPLPQSGLQSHNIARSVDDAVAGLYHVTRTLRERSSDSSSSSSGDTPASEQHTQNIAIILGVVIPMTIAIAVLIVLHRKHTKKQKLEDINDPHKSLDFGMDGIAPVMSKATQGSKGWKKGQPEMSVAEISGHGRPSKRGQGLSVDYDIGSPYLLPAGLNGSRESMHSMSRSAVSDAHDPYRPVIMMRPSTDNDSLRFGRLNADNGSLYSMSTGHHSTVRDNASLVANARPMSQSFAKRTDSMSPNDSTAVGEFPPRQMHSSLNRNGQQSRRQSMDKVLPEINEKEVMPSPITIPEPAAFQMPPPRSSSTSVSSAPRPSRKDSMSSVGDVNRPESSVGDVNRPESSVGDVNRPESSVGDVNRPESSNYDDDEAVPTSRVTINVSDSPYDINPAMIYSRYSADEPATVVAPTPTPAPQPPQGLIAPQAPQDLIAPQPISAQNRLSVVGGAGNRLSVMGLRPLPPDVPEDSPEVRANRIRSFYKEYFDDSKPMPAYAQYEDAYDGGFDGAIYDPDTGGFFVPGAKPFAQEPGRRAMTPPPRGKPRVSGNSSAAGMFPPHGRKFSTMSAGRPRGRSMPKKKAPPPMPLTTLPAPSKLREDIHIFTPIDFAPPSSFRETQNGRGPDSPMGLQRPYSPSVRAFTPLASSFENLAPLPSPHDLRRSGTFTALDFAPPSKIRDPNGSLSPSDAGSIRSARSGISQMQSQALASGAYRVSRIPKEMVTTKDDLSAQLRPKMDMTAYA